MTFQRPKKDAWVLVTQRAPGALKLIPSCKAKGLDGFLPLSLSLSLPYLSILGHGTTLEACAFDLKMGDIGNPLSAWCVEGAASSQCSDRAPQMSLGDMSWQKSSKRQSKAATGSP